MSAKFTILSEPLTFDYASDGIVPLQSGPPRWMSAESEVAGIDTAFLNPYSTTPDFSVSISLHRFYKLTPTLQSGLKR